jgi:hypothetical protein
MQRDSTVVEEMDMSPQQVWDTVVRVTGFAGSDEARSIRVLLYLVLVSGKRSSFWSRFRSRVNFVRRMALPRGRPLPPARKGCPLFAFLYDTPANTNNLLPVFQAAQKRGWDPGVLAGDGVELSTKGITEATCSIGVRELRSLTTIKEWLAALAAARKHFASVVREFDRQTPQWTPLIRNSRTGIVSELALGMVAKIGLVRLYSAWEPKFVISTANLWPFDCAVFTEAQRLGVPSFVVQHGITNHYWWPFVATKMLLWGKVFENELHNLGAPARQLAVCGMPAADNTFARCKSDAMRRIRGTASRILVLSHTHARDYEPELYTRYGIMLKAIAAATPSIRWYVKLHPVEDESFYHELLGGMFPNLSILPKSTTLEEAVAKADVTCTLWSTSGLEAMMMQRPLVVMDVAPKVHDYAWWPKSGGGTYAPTAEAMLAFITKASMDGQFLTQLVARQNEFLAQNFANSGRAAETILDTIEEVVRATNPETIGESYVGSHSTNSVNH